MFHGLNAPRKALLLLLRRLGHIDGLGGVSGSFEDSHNSDFSSYGELVFHAGMGRGLEIDFIILVIHHVLHCQNAMMHIEMSDLAYVSKRSTGGGDDCNFAGQPAV